MGEREWKRMPRPGKSSSEGTICSDYAEEVMLCLHVDRLGGYLRGHAAIAAQNHDRHVDIHVRLDCHAFLFSTFIGGFFFTLSSK